MAKRRMAVIAAVGCLFLWCMPCCVSAASTADAIEPIRPDESVSLTLSCRCEGQAFADVPVQLYTVASVSAGCYYTLTDLFAPSALELNGVQTNAEWDVIRSTLEARIVADAIPADTVARTDENGNAQFDALTPALYLAVIGTVTQGELTCVFESALLALPSLGEDGRWQYEVSVASKSERIPPSTEETEWTVTKLWKGDEGTSHRPTSIVIELFRAGQLYKTVTLSQENNWSYRWSAAKDGAAWTVSEPNVPNGYTMTVDERDSTFIVVNTFTEKRPDESIDTPQTGDTSNVMLYVILMIVSGGVLLILGMIGKKNKNENAN